MSWTSAKLLSRRLLDSSGKSAAASSHMFFSKNEPCLSQYKLLYGETANGSLKLFDGSSLSVSLVDSVTLDAHASSPSRERGPQARASARRNGWQGRAEATKRELEYRIPRLPSPELCPVRASEMHPRRSRQLRHSTERERRAADGPPGLRGSGALGLRSN